MNHDEPRDMKASTSQPSGESDLFVVESLGIVRLRLPDGSHPSVHSLGRDKIRVRSEADLGSGPARLTVFDKSMETTLDHDGGEGPLQSFCFSHRGSELAVFLRPLLQGLAWGTSLEIITQENLKAEYRTPESVVLHGHGPTHLSAALTTDHKNVDSFLLTFRSGDSYKELRYADGRFTTSHQIDRLGVAARMRSDTREDPNVLRLGLAILAGLQDERLTPLMHHVIVQGVERLNSPEYAS